VSAGEAIDRDAAAAAVGAGLGDRVADGTAELQPSPVPGLADQDAVWRVRDATADHPLQVYVGRWPDGTVRVLTDNQPAFFDLVETVGAELTDPETALGYVRALLEVTRGASVIVRVVSDLGDLRWRPGAPDEEARREAFVADPPIAPPRVEPTPDGFHVELCLVVDQRVQRNTFEVARDGTLSASYRVLAEDLPLPIAL
jgi:hypothetical protein